MTTTSASCFSATPRATVAPTFPAPPTTVTLRFISGRLLWLLALAFRLWALASRLWAQALHVLDHGVGKLRRLQLRGALHEAREIVSDSLGGDGAVHALHD